MGKNGCDVVSLPIVQVEELFFDYKIRHASANSLKQVAINLVKGVKSDVQVRALKDINFVLERGETLGIIGKNGAGKSTLLKLLSGILPPTHGNIKVRGKIAPLIELTAGFNPELNGIENIVLFGVLLGNSRSQMEDNCLSIAEWAGLSESIHLPVRTYSTGMVARLGFAVATFQQSELLIIDEILSVGDSQFQKKSIARIEKLIAGGEATILVSHDLNLIEDRATKVLWLEHGRQVMLGNPKEVLDGYRKS